MAKSIIYNLFIELKNISRKYILTVTFCHLNHLMATKQVKTYCRILDYVETIDPDLARLISGLCVDVVLGSTRGKPGITFLLPTDKAFREKLEKLTYSEKIEDVNKAADMLNALIIRDIFKTAAEWKSREVVNSLLPYQVVEVANTTAKEVTFKSGAKAVLDEKFVCRRDNLAVWTLTGEIPVTTDKPAQSPRKSKGKTGAYEINSAADQNERFKIALAVENAYVLSRLQPGHRDVYLEHSLSLIDYIMNVRRDEALMYEKVLPMISFDKMDFYFLVEPHRASGTYLLDDALIHEWWVQRVNRQCQPRVVMAAVEKMLQAGTGALVYTNREKILDQIDMARRQLGPIIESRPKSSIEFIAKYYAELATSNTILSAGPVYPAPLAAFYAQEPGLKMLHDELRFLAFGRFCMLESNAFDIGAFHSLTNMIGECLHASTADEREKQRKLLNKNALMYLISPAEVVQEIKTFVFSTMFMFIPMTCQEANELKQKHSITRPDPTKITIFNISKNLYKQHERLLHEADGAAHDIVAALKSLNVETLDKNLRDELRKKFT